MKVISAVIQLSDLFIFIFIKEKKQYYGPRAKFDLDMKFLIPLKSGT